LVNFFHRYRVQLIIEKQYEINMELASSKARAESESQEKSKFLANISHELRTPLNAIIGFSEIIQSETMGPLTNATYKEYIRDIHQSGTHLLSLINDILDFSKAEAQKLTVDMEEVVVNRVIRSSIKMLQAKAEQASLKLFAELPDEAVVIMADHKRLKQVLLNLLSNAIKFTPEGGQVSVALAVHSDSKTVDLIVKDTGIGISSKDIPRAMAIFGQVDNERSRKYEGTGLGLPLTKKLVELMRGQFTLMSAEGLGTTIVSSFPLQRLDKHQGDETEDSADNSAAWKHLLPRSAFTSAVSAPGVEQAEEKSSSMMMAREESPAPRHPTSLSETIASDGLTLDEKDLPDLDASGVTMLDPEDFKNHRRPKDAGHE
jgi:two-component system cell cycle sensor histidine kinase PleC